MGNVDCATAAVLLRIGAWRAARALRWGARGVRSISNRRRCCAFAGGTPLANWLSHRARSWARPRRQRSRSSSPRSCGEAGERDVAFFWRVGREPTWL